MSTKTSKAKLFDKKDLAKKTKEFVKDIHKGGERTHDVILTETSVTTVNKKSGRRMKIELLEDNSKASD